MTPDETTPADLESQFTGPYDSAFDVLDDRNQAANLNVRAQFMSRLADYIEEENLTQTEAGKRLGVHQSRISHLLNGHISMFTVDALIRMCDHAGIPVTVSFGDAHAGRAA
jgi:predicted XRE-type DNA-binding protein